MNRPLLLHPGNSNRISRQVMYVHPHSDLGWLGRYSRSETWERNCPLRHSAEAERDTPDCWSEGTEAEGLERAECGKRNHVAFWVRDAVVHCWYLLVMEEAKGVDFTETKPPKKHLRDWKLSLQSVTSIVLDLDSRSLLFVSCYCTFSYRSLWHSRQDKYFLASVNLGKKCEEGASLRHRTSWYGVPTVAMFRTHWYSAGWR